MLRNVTISQKFLNISLHLMVASRQCLFYVGERVFVQDCVYDVSMQPPNVFSFRAIDGYKVKDLITGFHYSGTFSLICI